MYGQEKDVSGSGVQDGEDYNPRELEPAIPKIIEYTAASANNVLDRVEEGYTLERVHAECGGPLPRIVYGWAKKCAVFNNALVDSLEIRAEVLMDQIPGITDGGGGAATIRERVKARQELAAFDNKRFVKRSTTQLTGADGGPVTLSATVSVDTPFSAYTPEQHQEWMEKDGHWLFTNAPKGMAVPSFTLPTGRPASNPSSLANLDQDELARELSSVPRDKLRDALNRYDPPSS